MTSLRNAWPAALVLLLAGCATTMPHRSSEQQRLVEQRWNQHREELAHIDRFLIKARLAYGKLLGVKADLHWQQKPDGSFQLRLSGPFGVGAATITGNRKRVKVRTRDGEYDTADPESWIEERMGWTLPINHLRHWVLGLPAPRSAFDVELDDEGRAAILEQADWHLEYTEYQSRQGYDLPRKFEISNDSVRLKVVVDEWSNLPRSPHP